MGDVISPVSSRLDLAEQSPPAEHSSPFVEDFVAALEQEDLSRSPGLERLVSHARSRVRFMREVLDYLPCEDTDQNLHPMALEEIVTSLAGLTTRINELLEHKSIRGLNHDRRLLERCMSLLHPPSPNIRQHVRIWFRQQQGRFESVSCLFAGLATLAYADARVKRRGPGELLNADFRKQFLGGAADDLRNHILELSGQSDTYVPVVAVLQSSGTGKTRTVLELAKKELGFYICLRPDPSPNQYLSLPPADRDARDFLTETVSHVETTFRMAAWLKAFADKFHEVCEGGMSVLDPAQRDHATLKAAVASKLKHDLAPAAVPRDDAWMDSPPPPSFRESFLHSIVEQATQYLKEINVVVAEYDKKLHEKQRQWFHEKRLKSNQGKGERYEEEKFYPDPIELELARWMSDSFQKLLQVLPKQETGFIFFAIDEAMTLEESSRYGIESLRQLLGHLKLCDHRFWIILLDTSIGISPLTETVSRHRQHTGNLQLPPPFTDLPQDVFLRQDKRLYNSILNGDVSVTNRHLVDWLPKMGRPLWDDRVYEYATPSIRTDAPRINRIYLEHIHYKLAGPKGRIGNPDNERIIAEAAQRIPLNMIGSAGETTEAGFLSKQISHHLRVIADYTPFAVKSWAPSEPLLSLSVASAFRISDPLAKWSEIVVEMADSHQNTDLMIGEHGEAFAQIMISCAIDQASRRGSSFDIHGDQDTCPPHLYPLRVDIFLNTLFGPAAGFSEDCQDWAKNHYINATHFARPGKQYHSPNSLAPRGLLAQAWSRNIGLLGVSNQTGYDILLPAQRLQSPWSLDLPFEPESFDVLCFKIKLKEQHSQPTNEWLYNQNTGIKAAEAEKDLNVYISLDAQIGTFKSPLMTRASDQSDCGPLGIYVGGCSAEQFPLIGHLSVEAQRRLPVFVPPSRSAANGEKQSFLDMELFVEPMT